MKLLKRTPDGTQGLNVLLGLAQIFHLNELIMVLTLGFLYCPWLCAFDAEDLGD